MVELPPGAVKRLSLIRSLPAKAKELRVIATNSQLTQNLLQIPGNVGSNPTPLQQLQI